MNRNRGSLLSLIGIFGVAVARAQEPVQEAIPNWPAPATWSPQSVRRGLSTMGAITSPLPFIGVTPCRQYDSRNATPLSQNTAREVVITGAPCGIPTVAAAVSLNVTVFDIQGQTGNAVFQVGTTNNPTTAWINYPIGQGQIGNAGVLPLSNAGSIFFRVLQGAGSIDFTIDVNGYYAGAGVAPFGNTFLGPGAGNFTMTGNSNTGIGASALLANTTGSNNTAVGGAALEANAGGNGNTAVGVNGLRNNTTGGYNTATGYGALYSNIVGAFNTAIGSEALYSNVYSSSNTAVGFGALSSTAGGDNTAVGTSALTMATGADNTAVGTGALIAVNAGAFNIALGTFAGTNLTSGNYNMYLGNEGVASESNTIRLGSGSNHSRLFVAGVLTSVVSANQVFISSTGQLGVASSSARYKEEIRDMGDSSDRLAKLRPVTFRYKGHDDEPIQFGLIAEEVEQVLPDLVFHSASGQPEAVLYHELPAMLLNELQKQQQRIDRQGQEIAGLLERVQALEGRLSEVPTK